MTELAAAIGSLGTWLRREAWPQWLQQGIDHDRAAFHESLPNAAEFRRLRVVTRQIYVFSEAHCAGLAGADAAVALGIAFLDRHAALPDGGYAWRFSLDNAVIDDTRDLYDHAFVLLALASAAKVMPAAKLRAQAVALLGWLDRDMAHPAGGFCESLPDPGGHRRQNPHMHLLEALLAAYETFGDAVFLARATDMIALFRDRMFDPDQGVLPEFFDARWHPAAHEGGALVEPGHHCEWVWLLDWYARLTRPDTRLDEIADALMRFVDRTGLVELVTASGQVIAGSTRLWAQAEGLKAALIRRDGAPAGQVEAAANLASYLHPDGTWHDRRDAEGRPVPAPAPATSLYHLTSAILTAERILLTQGAPPHTSPG